MDDFKNKDCNHLKEFPDVLHIFFQFNSLQCNFRMFQKLTLNEKKEKKIASFQCP